MSRQIALDNICLKPAPRWAHTEYALNYHQDYIRQCTGQAFGHSERGAQVFEKALVCKAAQVLEQITVIAKVRAQHLGDAEGEMPVRDRKKDRFG